MREPQQLVFDADDTLWENNIYFEQAFEDFVSYLDHSVMTAEEIRAVLDEIEDANRKTHGYGARNFGRNLRQCYERLCERHVAPADLDRVMLLAERILEQPVELIDDVEETIRDLASRHELLLFTKGHPEEQKLKIDRSGLAPWFMRTAIVREKDADSYRALARDCGLEFRRAWMIGNSPRSDINPALEAGLGAVYVPHARTWVLERCDIARNGGRLIEVERFGDLRRHF